MDGTGLDVGGAPADLPPGFAHLVHAAYPRLGGSRALGAAIEAQALADPRKAPPASLAGVIIQQRHPELPTLTWDAIVAMSGWGRLTVQPSASSVARSSAFHSRKPSSVRPRRQYPEIDAAHSAGTPRSLRT